MIDMVMADPNINYEDLPDQTLIVGRDGIYLRKKNLLIDCLVKVKSYPEVETFAHLNIPQIPYNLIYSIYKFFELVELTFKNCEALVILYYDYETSQYFIDIPDQMCSVDYCVPTNPDDNTPEEFYDYFRIGSIHSHGKDMAYHSGTDVESENSWDGIHLTLGNINIPRISIACSIVINDNRFQHNPCDWISDLPILIENIKSKTGYTYTHISHPMNEPDSFIDLSDNINKIHVNRKIKVKTKDQINERN